MTTLATRRLVDKLWNYCNVLRDDGVSTIDYVEQLTFLLFLKMADEAQARPAMFREQVLPAGPAWEGRGWAELVSAKGDALEIAYRHLLEDLGNSSPGTTFNLIFNGARNKIQDPAKLRRLIVDLIGKEDWSQQGTDVKGDAYEELLARGAEDIKSGAGQYFTPRSLIQAIVDCVRPTPDDTITDPACGTGGFLLAAAEYLIHEYGTSLTPEQRRALSSGGIWGTELVRNTARLAAMNLFLHGIGHANGPKLVRDEDALAQPPAKRASLVLANPPFGKKSSITVYGEDGSASREAIAYERRDFWVTTTNKQLNFVQHIASLLEIHGRAAVVLPDNVLFEGGAGETIRRRLLKEYDLHTMLRLPTGIFYAGGVKANVLFFDRKPARPEQPWTEKLWVYDFRTAQHFTLKQNPLMRATLDDFVTCFAADDRSKRIETERFKPFTYDELVARDKVSLDITWLRDPSLEDADSLPAPEEIAADIVEDLQAALDEFAAIADSLREARQQAAQDAAVEGVPVQGDVSR
ncbi:class I SAM-dependent DNA methyltransferase [Kitasatospora sp. NPDC002227]|uniref:class I SAM-dependent DNA methyltransferase n=1 Tax=Kitasatospora sp. NPDC002227 TaxID=3154773 RepID=UPI0033182FC4